MVALAALVFVPLAGTCVTSTSAIRINSHHNTGEQARISTHRKPTSRTVLFTSEIASDDTGRACLLHRRPLRRKAAAPARSNLASTRRHSRVRLAKALLVPPPPRGVCTASQHTIPAARSIRREAEGHGLGSSCRPEKDRDWGRLLLGVRAPSLHPSSRHCPSRHRVKRKGPIH